MDFLFYFVQTPCVFYDENFFSTLQDNPVSTINVWSNNSSNYVRHSRLREKVEKSPLFPSVDKSVCLGNIE